MYEDYTYTFMGQHYAFMTFTRDEIRKQCGLFYGLFRRISTKIFGLCDGLKSANHVFCPLSVCDLQVQSRHRRFDRSSASPGWKKKVHESP